MLTESDEALVQRLLPQKNSDSSDREAGWNEWCGSLSGVRVRRRIRQLKRNNEPVFETVDDLFQDAILSAYVAVESGRYEYQAGKFTAYVKRIALYKFLEALRRATSDVYVEPGDGWERIENRFQPRDGELKRPPEIAFERRQEHETLQGYLRMLHPRRAEVLAFHFEGCTTREIAMDLGISEELVRQDKRRGLESLRQMGILTDALFSREVDGD
jgi:RNA polymerase sigma factor (sigma-70 family)